MIISQNGIDLIKQFEGLRLNAYQDTGKVWTIGYGHTGEEAQPGNTITEKEAEDLLRKDCEYAENEVNKLSVEFTQNQFDALCSLVFNVGMNRLMNRYSIIRMITNNPYNERIPALWQATAVKDRTGTVLKGLQRRRILESNLYIK